MLFFTYAFTKERILSKMNEQDFEILKKIDKDGNISQRTLAQKTGYSLGKINKSIKELCENKYINNSLELTEKSEELFRRNMVT